MDERAHGNKSATGFVLILVIWITALLALFALSFASSVQSHLRLTANSVQSAKAEALADAGVELAALSLLAGPNDRRFPVDGSAHACLKDGVGVVTLRIQDSGGKVSINLANERLLQALFLGLGASRELASRYTDVIIDYRDADSNRRPNGAELPEYLEAGRALGPKNAPFDTIEELNQVLGLDPAMIALITPHVTVHSQTAGLDPRTASPELGQILSRGIEQLPARASPQTVSNSPVPSEFVNGSPQRVFLVASEGRLENGARFVRETVMELQSTRAATPIYKIWKRGTNAASDPPSGELPPC